MVNLTTGLILVKPGIEKRDHIHIYGTPFITLTEMLIMMIMLLGGPRLFLLFLSIFIYFFCFLCQWIGQHRIEAGVS